MSSSSSLYRSRQSYWRSTLLLEAARAGEHSKGFSIVAVEVTNLAIGTEQSASEIQVAIVTTQTQIKEVANEMESGMKEIDKGTEK